MSFLNLLAGLFKRPAAPAAAPAAPGIAPGLPSDHVHEDMSASHASIHVDEHIAAVDAQHAATASPDRAALEAWWSAHAGDPSHPVDLNAPEVVAIFAMDRADIAAFGGPFLAAWKHAMRYETGKDLPMDDPVAILGLVDTRAEQIENGYTDGVTGASRNDSGGETKDGWAKTAHPSDDIKKIRLAKILRGYKSGYWDACSGDLLKPRVAAIVFDVACGSGPRKGCTMLQQALGVAVDGAIGPATLAAANAMDPVALTEKIHQLRVAYYREIGVGHNAEFLNGWLNRANDVLAL